jgi:transcriptional regulatory protein RtcR
MPKQKQNVVIGLLGAKQDKESSTWRPTTHLVTQAVENNFIIHHFRLLYQKRDKKLAEKVKQEIESLSPKTMVHPDALETLAWDYEKVCSRLYQYVSDFSFDYNKQNYYIHITTGTETVKNCWILLLTKGVFRAQIIQTHNPAGGETTEPYRIVDTDEIRQQIMLWQNKDTEKRLSESNQLSYKEIYEQVREISASPDFSSCRFLLMGETGTGKTQLAKDIVKKELKLTDNRFVDLNCAGLSEQTAMSELCGYVKGAFTGAEKDTIGKLKLAEGGVLFLDEIGELPLSVQAMLLRCIEDKEFYPVGGTKKIKTDFRLFCATNKDLQKEVTEGRFRKDLFHRINLWSYYIPSIREQIKQIKNLADELVRKKEESVVFENNNARQVFIDFAKDAEWQGNYRDFNDIFTRMTFFAKRTQNGTITQDILESEIARLKDQWNKGTEGKTTNLSTVNSENVFDSNDYKSDTYYKRLCEKVGEEKINGKQPIDIIQLLAVLRCCKGKKNVADMGRVLFPKRSNSSDAMGKFLKKFGLDWQTVQDIVR